MNDKLLKIQSELKAPKGQTNSFGNYMYRSCEDILEAVKPLLKEQGLTLLLTDKVTNVGAHNYVVATAIISDDKDHHVEVTAYAREAETKKGMDDAQITGACSSYARKYALNGLFAIDDTKDADTQDNKDYESKPAEKKSFPATVKQVETLLSLAKAEGATNKDEAIGYVEERAGCKVSELTSTGASKLIGEMMK